MRVKTLGRRLLNSLIGVTVGWAVGFLYYSAGHDFFSRWVLLSDVLDIAFWSAAFVVASWVVFILPVVSFVPPASAVFRLPLAALLGGLWYLLAFLLLVGIWTGYWASLFLLGYSLVVGITSGSIYAVLLGRSNEMNS
jgi:hypothetical protein